MICFFKSKKLDNIENLLAKTLAETIRLNKEIKKMALDLTVLTEEVARLETVEASAVALVKALADEVAANVNDPAALQALVDRIKASDDTLAAAVAANTPAAPAV
jgi:uncharacterized coiled-coil protein SlyX